MKRVSFAFYCFVAGMLFFSEYTAQAYVQHVWRVTSPDHEQTFTCGLEQSRVWVTRGVDKHLALLLNFTNDPYVDRNNPREHDNFTFNFPKVMLGADGHTYYYRTSDGRSLPVAVKRSDFFDVDEIKLLNSSYLIVKKPHGYLSLMLVIQDHPLPTDSE
jgi:hypothetical protein